MLIYKSFSPFSPTYIIKEEKKNAEVFLLEVTVQWVNMQNKLATEKRVSQFQLLNM